jgi:hypothetical protein
MSIRMSMKRVNLYMEEKQIAWLSKVAKGAGNSMANMIRECVRIAMDDLTAEERKLITRKKAS